MASELKVFEAVTVFQPLVSIYARLANCSAYDHEQPTHAAEAL
jgi:hypothetical protein